MFTKLIKLLTVCKPFPVVETTEELTDPIERDSRAPRGSRPIFECYWNGRLIPYTAVDV